MARETPQVYRIDKGNGPGLAIISGGFGFVAAYLLGLRDGASFWGLVALAGLLGYLLGDRARRRSCSGCAEPLVRSDEHCPKCGGVIRGVVRSRRALARQQAGQKKRP
jgi:hypothetical protein